MSAVSIAATQTVTVATADTVTRSANLTANLTAGVRGAPFFNQGFGIAAALKVTANPTPSVYPPVEFFTVICNLTAFVVDYVDTGYAPDRQPISATIKFIPRLPAGTVLWLPGQGIVLATIKARFDTDGTLKTIQGDPGVQLVANTTILGLDALVYDVSFSNVVYAKADQSLQPFAFNASTVGGSVVDLSRVTKVDPKPGLL